MWRVDDNGFLIRGELADADTQQADQVTKYFPFEMICYNSVANISSKNCYQVVIGSSVGQDSEKTSNTINQGDVAAL